MKFLLGILCVALLSASPVAVRADDVSVESTEELSLRYETPAEDSKQRLAGPRAGLVFSSILAVGGVMMVASGAAIMALESSCWFSTDCDAEAGAGGKALVGVGVFVTVGGFASLAISAKRLKERKRKRSPSQPRLVGQLGRAAR